MIFPHENSAQQACSQLHNKFCVPLPKQQNKENDNVVKGIKWIWKLNCPNKLKFFLWLCRLNRLQTCTYLNILGIKIDEKCYFCNYPESISHIFLEYSIAHNFWQKLGVSTEISMIHNSNNHWLDSVRNLRSYLVGNKLSRD